MIIKRKEKSLNISKKKWTLWKYMCRFQKKILYKMCKIPSKNRRDIDSGTE